jgi:hypothetical protein
VQEVSDVVIELRDVVLVPTFQAYAVGKNSVVRIAKLGGYRYPAGNLMVLELDVTPCSSMLF